MEIEPTVEMSLLNVTAVEIELAVLVEPAVEIEPAVLISAGSISTSRLNFHITSHFTDMEIEPALLK